MFYAKLVLDVAYVDIGLLILVATTLVFPRCMEPMTSGGLTER